jgi:hypothetical protein
MEGPGEDADEAVAGGGDELLLAPLVVWAEEELFAGAGGCVWLLECFDDARIAACTIRSGRLPSSAAGAVM